MEKEKTKNLLLWLLKIGVSLTILVLVFRRFHLTEVLNYWKQISILTIIQVLSLTLLNLFLQYRRWLRIVTRHLQDVSTARVRRSFLAGIALRVLLPGGYAEVGKVLFLNGGKGVRLFAYGLEKYLTFFTQIVLIGVSGLILFPEQRLFFLLLSIPGLLLIVVLPWLCKLPLFQKLLRNGSSLSPTSLVVVLYSIGVYLTVAFQYYLLLPSKVVLSIFTVFAVTMMLIGAAIIPVSFMGLGLRELVGIYLYTRFNLSEPEIVGMTLTIFLFNILLPAVGGLIVILQAKRRLIQVGENEL